MVRTVTAALLTAAIGWFGGVRIAVAPGPFLAAYWESWDDTNPPSQFGPLGSLPQALDIVEVADFEIDNGSATYQGPYNEHPLGPGAAALHARGAKIFLSIGGYSSQWGVESVASFLQALQRVFDANPGVFDGLDFDDENIPYQDATPQAGQREIVTLVRAAHARWPRMALSYTAFVMGADEPVRWSDDQGEDVAVLRELGGIVNFVNVMEYTQNLGNGKIWKPARFPQCRWQPGSSADCYLDVLGEFAHLELSNGSTLGARKIVMGLEVHPEQHLPPALTPLQMEAYARWVRANGYGGVAVWSIDRDRPGVSGYQLGAFTAALANGLDRSERR